MSPSRHGRDGVPLTLSLSKGERDALPFVILSEAKNLVSARGNMASYYVYIMTNRSGTLYTGVTNDLERRVYEHKQGVVDGFTKGYKLTRLVFYEETADINAAIAREKQIKGWLRSKKLALIQSGNPRWVDLSEGWSG